MDGAILGAYAVRLPWAFHSEVASEALALALVGGVGAVLGYGIGLLLNNRILGRIRGAVAWGVVLGAALGALAALVAMIVVGDRLSLSWLIAGGGCGGLSAFLATWKDVLG